MMLIKISVITRMIKIEIMIMIVIMKNGGVTTREVANSEKGQGE